MHQPAPPLNTHAGQRLSVSALKATECRVCGRASHQRQSPLDTTAPIAALLSSHQPFTLVTESASRPTAASTPQQPIKQQLIEWREAHSPSLQTPCPPHPSTTTQRLSPLSDNPHSVRLTAPACRHHAAGWLSPPCTQPRGGVHGDGAPSLQAQYQHLLLSRAVCAAGVSRPSGS